MKYSIQIKCAERAITRRAHEVVSLLIQEGTDPHDIARLTGCTVAMLLDSATVLNRSHYTALAAHFDVNRLWLWTGYGPMFTSDSSTLTASIS